MKRSINQINRVSAQHGFSLLEVLIALLVLSIGLLGLAGLQTLGLKFNTQSYQRTQAVILAYDIIDRIRANPVGKNNELYDAVSAGAPPPAGSYKDCTSSTCDPTEMATYDIGEWKNAIDNLLGANADGQITTADPIRSITVSWVENDISMRLVVEADLSETSIAVP